MARTSTPTPSQLKFQTLPVETENYRFQLVYIGGPMHRWQAIAYGDPLPRRGLARTADAPWAALAAAATAAASYEYLESRKQAKRGPLPASENGQAKPTTARPRLKKRKSLTKKKTS